MKEYGIKYEKEMFFIVAVTLLFIICISCKPISVDENVKAAMEEQANQPPSVWVQTSAEKGVPDTVSMQILSDEIIK